jgi:hypothetical protein
MPGLRNRAESGALGRLARDVLKEGLRTKNGFARPLRTEEYERVGLRQ